MASGAESDCRSLYDWDPNTPTILVMGSEGTGLRSLVSRSCNGFVKVDGGNRDTRSDSSGVDSLNVSVTAGILLNYFGQRRS